MGIFRGIMSDLSPERDYFGDEIDGSNKKELNSLYMSLFKEIEHGDQEHRDWLYNKLVEFQNRK